MTNMDETTPGGAYIKDGKVVDANGVERPGWTIDDSGNAVAPVAKSKAKAQDTPPATNAPGGAG